MAGVITTISPITNQPILTHPEASPSELESIVQRSAAAFKTFSKTTRESRKAIISKALDLLAAKQDELAKELTEQMGRPIAYTGKEVATAVLRGKYLLEIGDEALADTPGKEEKGFKRWIQKCPKGPVLVIFAWNVSTPFGLL
jgi:acyl-CoA reductase-like NAD-dependent aldehyde dehydrogenase